MFVVTMNRKGVKRIIIIACSFVLVCTTLVGGVILLSDDVAQVMADGSTAISVTDIQDISVMFEQYGIKTDVTTGEVSSVVIPSSFDDDFTAFNEIIMEGGGDISRLKSRTVERWKLLTTNRTANDDMVWAIALVRNNDVVGCYLLSEPSGQVHSVNDESLSAPQSVDVIADTVQPVETAETAAEITQPVVAD